MSGFKAQTKYDKEISMHKFIHECKTKEETQENLESEGNTFGKRWVKGMDEPYKVNEKTEKRT